MIPRSRLIAILALLVALATHAAVMLDFGDKPETKIKGGGDAGVAALGNSFRNMTAGTIPPETPDMAEPSKQEPIKQSEPQSSQTALPAPSTARAPEQTKPAQPAPPQQQKAALAPAPMAALTPVTSPQTPTPPQLKTQPPQPQQKASVAPPKLEPTDQKKTPVKPIKDKPKTKKKQAAAPKGNSAKNERVGQASGKSKSKKSTASASGRKAAQQGNAAASNYRGIVLRKINRARRKSTKIRGTALVSLRIADNGSLAHVSISRSSGSARLDKIALSQVRAAAPFPRPPAGANRAYSVKIGRK
jgi:periplasmic protein TonB